VLEWGGVKKGENRITLGGGGTHFSGRECAAGGGGGTGKKMKY